MGNTYRALTEAARAAFFVGVFEHDFTIADEADWLAKGVIEIVPRRYRVLVDNAVYGVTCNDADPTFEAALLKENEAALIGGGHIERVEPPTEKPTRKKKEA